MPQQYQDNNSSRTARRRKRLIWLAVIVVVAMSVAVQLIRSSDSVHKELAAIEAARAIPDCENAALAYYQILDEYPLVLPKIFFPPGITGYPTHDVLSPMAGPTAYHAYVPMLQHASKMKECRLSLNLDLKAILRRIAFREEMAEWVRLLCEFAKRNEALGRFDAAFEEYLCMTRMAKHCYQQRTREGMFIAASPECGALGGFNRLIVNGNATETQLTTIDKVVSELQADWEQAWPQIRRVEELYAEYWRREWTLQRCLSKIRINKQVYHKSLPFPNYPALPRVYLRRLSWRRGTRILIALRRYKDRNGHWPQSLKDLACLAPADVFIDPINEGEFIYRLKRDTFILYSKGKNGIDEHVGWDFSHPISDNPDDIPIWPALVWGSGLK